MMDRRLVFGFSSVYFLLFLVSEVKGTLIPNGTVPLDCGNQHTFTCSVTGVTAVWNITGLNGITSVEVSGRSAAVTNARITTTDASGLIQTSIITITGFNTSDNGGRVQCINLADSAVQGMATLSVGTPSCSTKTTSTRDTDYTAADIAWSQPPNSPPVTSTTVTYCPTSSPNCGNSVTCTSPCTISGLDPCGNYSVTVTPANNCGSAAGCTMNIMDNPSQGTPSCPTMTTSTRNTDFTAATVTWSQPVGPPVTSTTVSYCRTSSPNCGISTTCTSPCTISGLDPCFNYSVTVTPSNNCGSATGCTMNTVDSPSQGRPSCPKYVTASVVGSAVSVTWTRNHSPHITLSEVIYCPVSSPDCGTNVTCTRASLCLLEGLQANTNYSFTVLPWNVCGRTTQMQCMNIQAFLVTPGPTEPSNNTVVIAVVVVVVIILLTAISIFIAIIIICCCYSPIFECFVATYSCCSPAGKDTSKSRKLEPFEPQGGEYADPQEVRNRKAENEEKGITYAALEFSENAGSTGQANIRSKEEAVHYMAVEHA